jgi:transposase
VIGVDDFALRRRHRYATVIIDAETHKRIDVLPGRTAGTLEAWLREHPGIDIVCRDGSATYAEAIRRALPDAVQVADRWHVRHNLCEAALSEVTTHSARWAAVLDAPSTTGHAPRPPWNADTRSTTCSTRASACPNAPAASNWR